MGRAQTFDEFAKMVAEGRLSACDGGRVAQLGREYLHVKASNAALALELANASAAVAEESFERESLSKRIADLEAELAGLRASAVVAPSPVPDATDESVSPSSEPLAPSAPNEVVPVCGAGPPAVQEAERQPPASQDADPGAARKEPESAVEAPTPPPVRRLPRRRR